MSKKILAMISMCLITACLIACEEGTEEPDLITNIELIENAIIIPPNTTFDEEFVLPVGTTASNTITDQTGAVIIAVNQSLEEEVTIKAETKLSGGSIYFPPLPILTQDYTFPTGTVVNTKVVIPVGTLLTQGMVIPKYDPEQDSSITTDTTDEEIQENYATLSGYISGKTKNYYSITHATISHSNVVLEKNSILISHLTIPAKAGVLWGDYFSTLPAGTRLGNDEETEEGEEADQETEESTLEDLPDFAPGGLLMPGSSVQSIEDGGTIQIPGGGLFIGSVDPIGIAFTFPADTTFYGGLKNAAGEYIIEPGTTLTEEYISETTDSIPAGIKLPASTKISMSSDQVTTGILLSEATAPFLYPLTLSGGSFIPIAGMSIQGGTTLHTDLFVPIGSFIYGGFINPDDSIVINDMAGPGKLDAESVLLGDIFIAPGSVIGTNRTLPAGARLAENPGTNYYKTGGAIIPANAELTSSINLPNGSFILGDSTAITSSFELPANCTVLSGIRDSEGDYFLIPQTPVIEPQTVEAGYFIDGPIMVQNNQVNYPSGTVVNTLVLPVGFELNNTYIFPANTIFPNGAQDASKTTVVQPGETISSPLTLNNGAKLIAN